MIQIGDSYKTFKSLFLSSGIYGGGGYGVGTLYYMIFLFQNYAR